MPNFHMRRLVALQVADTSALDHLPRTWRDLALASEQQRRWPRSSS